MIPRNNLGHGDIEYISSIKPIIKKQAEEIIIADKIVVLNVKPLWFIENKFNAIVIDIKEAKVIAIPPTLVNLTLCSFRLFGSSNKPYLLPNDLIGKTEKTPITDDRKKFIINKTWGSMFLIDK